MNILDWAWRQPTRLERDFAFAAAGYAISFSDSQKMGESQTGAARFGGAPVMLATMRELLKGLGKVANDQL